LIILLTNFLYERHFGSFFYVQITRENLPKWHLNKKFICKIFKIFKSVIVDSEIQSNLCITTNAMHGEKIFRLFQSLGLSVLLMSKTGPKYVPWFWNQKLLRKRKTETGETFGMVCKFRSFLLFLEHFVQKYVRTCPKLEYFDSLKTHSKPS